MQRCSQAGEECVQERLSSGCKHVVFVGIAPSMVHLLGRISKSTPQSIRCHLLVCAASGSDGPARLLQCGYPIDTCAVPEEGRESSFDIHGLPGVDVVLDWVKRTDRLHAPEERVFEQGMCQLLLMFVAS